MKLSLLIATAILSHGLAEAHGELSDWLRRALSPGPFSLHNFNRFPKEFKQHDKFPKLEHDYKAAKIEEIGLCPNWKEAKFFLSWAVGEGKTAHPGDAAVLAKSIKDLNTVSITYKIVKHAPQRWRYEEQKPFPDTPNCGTITVEKKWDTGAGSPETTKPFWHEPVFHYDHNIPPGHPRAIVPEEMEHVMEAKAAFNAINRGSHTSLGETVLYPIKAGFKKVTLTVDKMDRPVYEFAGIPGYPETGLGCIDFLMDIKPETGAVLGKRIYRFGNATCSTGEDKLVPNLTAALRDRRTGEEIPGWIDFWH